MTDLNPRTVGTALGLTVAIAYAICTLVFYLWPGAGMEFVNALAHGLDFRKLETAAPWSPVAFATTVVILGIWGFAVGALFAWLYNRLNRGNSHD